LTRFRLAGRRPTQQELFDAAGAMNGEDIWAELRRELARSRRYERRFVVIRVPCETEGASPASSGTVGRKARELSAFLRSVDRAWSAEAGVYLLLPESDRSMGEAFLARVRRQAPELLPEDGVAMAVFPEDGWTSGALIAAVEGRPLVGPDAGPQLPSAEDVGAVVDLRPTQARADERA
jgi:hypothetical protein